MKKQLLVSLFVFLATAQAMACSCASPRDMIQYNLAVFQEIDARDIEFITYKETYHFVPAIPNVIRGALSRDPMRECVLGCSSKGTRIVANVQYLKDGEVCSAKLIKSAFSESNIKLKNISCRSN